jgi:hypothetical protein
MLQVNEWLGSLQVYNNRQLDMCYIRSTQFSKFSFAMNYINASTIVLPRIPQIIHFIVSVSQQDNSIS